MPTYDWWNEAVGTLTPAELQELERLLEKRKRPRAAPKAPAPRKPDGRIWFIPSDPNDKLGDFRDKTRPGDAQHCYDDGV